MSIGSIAILACIFLWMAGSVWWAIASGTIRYFHAIGWEHTLIEVSVFLIGIASLYLARRWLGWLATKLARAVLYAATAVLGIIYFAVATIFWVSAVAAAFSLLSLLMGGLTSFLTAPIGLKPGTETTGLAALWWPLFFTALVSRALYLIGKHLRDRTETAPMTATPHKNPEASTFPMSR